MRIGRPLACMAVIAASIAACSVRAGPIDPSQIRVVDGDTIKAAGTTWRLVGFDAPETGSRSRCEQERALGKRAAGRLRELVAEGNLTLESIPCSCRPGTEGTIACNYGRRCATLSSHGRDVGAVLIAERLAVPYHCTQTRCPKRMHDWCSRSSLL